MRLEIKVPKNRQQHLVSHSQQCSSTTAGFC